MPTPTKKQIENFLRKKGFFHFQKLDYLAKLKNQIKKAIASNSPTNFSLPLKIDSTNKDFILMELGGTYLRLSISIKNKIRQSQPISFYQKKIYTPDSLCQDLIKHLKKFLGKSKLQNMELIFVVANALHCKLIQKEIHGTLLFFGKNHQEKNLLGKDLQPILKNYLVKNHLHFNHVHLVNDTVISSFSGYTNQSFQSKKFPTIITLIVGTGINLSLAQPKNNQLFLANLEMGDFNFLRKSLFDRHLDAQSLIPGRFLTEKILSGAWTKDLYQIILEELDQNKLIPAKKFFKKTSRLRPAELEEYLQKGLLPEEKPYQYIWSEMHNRGAYINALIIAQLLKTLRLQSSPLMLLTGSLLEHDTYYKQQLITHLHKFCRLYRLKMPHISQNPPKSVIGTKMLLKLV